MEQCPINMRVVKSQLSHSLGALALLAEAGRGARLTDIAERLAAPKSSVQRLLHQLAEEGWVEQDNDTGYYRLSFRMAVLGQRHLQSIGIADATEAVLTELARHTRELARLTIVDGDRLVWIGSAQGAQPGLMYQPAMGGRIVSFATANGKAWLATLSARDLERIATRDGLGAKAVPPDVGPNAHRSMASLRRDLATVSKQGFAISDQEAESGVAALAVAVLDPASDRALGTISIAGPIVRLPRERHAELVRNLKAAAVELSRIWPIKRSQPATVQTA
jgi:IclR family transcriptional regulator, acetate operon repressor